ncbi:MAG: phosphoribosylaminoimidazolesuccinocarboxamide synthase [Phycisphaerae bacterium]|nr:phosphoribosylaminoimidazolesuccinocarboxamide synthase [Phycisphaerae bacterium]
MADMMQSELREMRLLRRGKVRDVYDLGENLLFVATDRLSAFDCVMRTPIPEKGRVLTALSAFWFPRIAHLSPHHFLTTDVPHEAVVLGHESVLRGRSMVVRRAEVLPIEFVIRGYLFGSAYHEYVQRGTACGVPLPKGLRLAQKLPSPILTPATKSHDGHDINISHKEAIRAVGETAFREAEQRALQIYSMASEFLESRAILLADTKFEFGVANKQLCVVDEILTPDSSRFWDAASYAPGKNPESFDKQFVRDYLLQSGWNKEPPPPELPPDIVARTSDRYLEALRRIVVETA